MTNDAQPIQFWDQMYRIVVDVSDSFDKEMQPNCQAYVFVEKSQSKANV